MKGIENLEHRHKGVRGKTKWARNAENEEQQRKERVRITNELEEKELEKKKKENVEGGASSSNAKKE